GEQKGLAPVDGVAARFDGDGHGADVEPRPAEGVEELSPGPAVAVERVGAERAARGTGSGRNARRRQRGGDLDGVVLVPEGGPAGEARASAELVLVRRVELGEQVEPRSADATAAEAVLAGAERRVGADHRVGGGGADAEVGAHGVVPADLEVA